MYRFCIFVFSNILHAVVSLDARVYLTSSCNGSSSFTTGISVQSSTALTYSNSMNCYYTVTAPSGFLVVAVFRRFELEPEMNGACVDEVNFYDGTSPPAAKLNASPYCGFTSPTNITSTGTSLTVELVTDTTGVFRGFDLMLSAFTNSPCTGDQFACSNNLCISSDLKCDNYNQCGDNSDEASCTAEELAGSVSADNSALIAGLCIGLGSLVVIAVLIGIYVYRQYRWKLFLKDPLPVIQQWDKENNYPLTNKYYKSFDAGYKPMKSNDADSSSQRPTSPNSEGSSSKGILKFPNHSTA